MNRELSSFDIYALVSELQDLIGSYVDNIYHLTQNELLIRIKNIQTNQKESIFIRNEELLCRTQQQFTTPIKPSTFAMTLRKYLLNGKITAITQQEFDRIITIMITKKEGDHKLIVELFKKGNIILVNPEGKIILPLITQQWAHRTIKTHEPYVFPPPQINPFTIDFEEFVQLCKKSNRDLVRTLAVNLNLSGPYAEELCARANVDKNTEVATITDTVFKNVYSALIQFLDIFTKKRFQPTIVKEDGKIVDVLPLPFISYRGKDTVPTDNYSRSLQECISIKKIEKQEVRSAQKKIERLQRQLQQQTRAVEKFKHDIERKKREGDLIYLNFQACQELLDDIISLLKQKNKEEAIENIKEKTFVKSFDPTANELIVVLCDNKGELVEVNLDFRKTVAENAKRAYEESKRLRGKVVGAVTAIERTKEEIQKLEAKDTKEIVEKENEIKKGRQFWFEKFRWCISSEGNIMIAGRDAKSNDFIVKKYLKPEDRYVHADIHGAASCVVKNLDMFDRKLPISEKTLEEACIFASCYSKAWKQFGEVQAYWVLPEQVSKTPESGEFLPKGAFVIRGKRNYYRCKLELAIGLVTTDNTVKVMGGAEASVHQRSDRFVIVAPGDSDRTAFIHTLAKMFTVPHDEIMRILPPGNMRIVKTFGVKIR